MSEAVVTPPKSKYWDETKKKFTITTQLRDKEGNLVGNPQYFEDDTLEGLLEKKDAAHANASVALYETRKKVKLGEMLEPDPEEPIQTFEERALTADERVKLTKALNDPATAPDALRTLIEAQFGAPVSAVREALQQVEIDKRVKSIQLAIAEFKEQTPDYVESAANRENIEKYMEKHKLRYTVKNLKIAFNALKDDDLITIRAPKAVETTPAPAPASQSAGAPAPTPAIPEGEKKAAPAIPNEPTEVRARSSSSGLGRDNSSAVPGAVAPKAQGITIRDINRMSAQEYQQKLQDPEFRKAVEELYSPKK